MSNTQDLVAEFLARGGKINKIPMKNFDRAEHEAPVLKTRRIISDLKVRAEQIRSEG